MPMVDFVIDVVKFLPPYPKLDLLTATLKGTDLRDCLRGFLGRLCRSAISSSLVLGLKSRRSKGFSV